MAIDDTIQDALVAELESSLDSQYSTLPLPTIELVATYIWDGTGTVLSADTSELVVGDYIQLDSDGAWYEVVGITPNVSVSVSDVYAVGSFPSGSLGTSKLSGDPIPPVSGTGNLDTFAGSIATAFSDTPHELPSVTVTNLPSASPAGRMVFVSDAATGSIPAFSDGTDWRRVDTRAIVT